MTKPEALAWIERSKIVPVVRASSSAEAEQLVECLLEGGIDIFEITMTVPGAVDVIRRLSERFGNQVLIGAGTVTSVVQLGACLEAGAQFIVSPHTDVEIIRHCKKKNVYCAAGALSPTEIMTAVRAGADVIKLFPCDAVGGASYIKSLKGPFPNLKFMPTGGVTLENVASFFDAGSTAVGVGSNLADARLLALNRQELVHRAIAFCQAAKLT